MCLSALTSSTTFAITKCGHTFHQPCINRWIKERKNCPTCRTNVSETDVIKLFIQECETTRNKTAVEKIENSLCARTKYNDYTHIKMKKCKCEIVQYKNGNQKYQYREKFDVNIRYQKSSGIIKVNLPSGYIVTTYSNMQIELLRTKTNEKTIITPTGMRFEYFRKEFSDGSFRFDMKSTSTQPMTVRSEYDYAKNGSDYTRLFCPDFILTRYRKDGRENELTIEVFLPSDLKNSLKVVFCLKHQIFCVTHLNLNVERNCNYSQKPCKHFKH